MKLFNDVEKYEIEVTKMGQNYSFFLTVTQTQIFFVPMLLLDLGII